MPLTKLGLRRESRIASKDEKEIIHVDVDIANTGNGKLEAEGQGKAAPDPGPPRHS